MIIAIDFDGTIVEHRFPGVGKPIPGAFDYMRKFQELNAKLILYTMRSDSPDKKRMVLTAAIEFCESHGIKFWAHNINPDQHYWTESPKPYANVYIDDAAFGCPLVYDPVYGYRPYVDWSIVGPAIVERLEAEQERAK